jgi:hypothetical protein
MGDMVIAIIFDEPDDDIRLAKLIDRAQKYGRDIPDVRIKLARGMAASTIRFFAENNELPADESVDALVEDSNLVQHAKRELELIGEEEWIVNGYLKMIRIFAGMGHSGGSASIFIPTLNALLSYNNLSPLTDSPNEWMQVTPDDEDQGCWQSKRNPEAFSDDGGKTYYLLSEGGRMGNPNNVLHETEKSES